MIEWSRAFDCADLSPRATIAPWVMRPDPAVRFWEGDARELLPGTAERASAVAGTSPAPACYTGPAGAGGEGALLTADTISVVADRRLRQPSCRAIPNLIPLGADAIRRIVAAVEPYSFDRLYGGWSGSIVATDAKRRSVAPPPVIWTASNAERRSPDAVLARPPQEHPFERIEEWPRVLELGEQALPVPLQEARPELSRETAFVVREHTPPHPLHDRLPRFQLVGVDLQADALFREPQAVQERRVDLGR